MGNNPSQAMAAAAAKSQMNSALGIDGNEKELSAKEKKAAEEAARKKEEIEERKVKWQEKQAELECKKQLLKTKRELETDGLTKDEIIALFPDTAVLFRE